MINLDKILFWKNAKEEIDKMMVSEHSPLMERSPGDTCIGTIKNEEIKKISMYLDELGQDLNELEELDLVVDDVDGTETLSDNEIETLKEMRDLEDKIKILKFFMRKLMEEELGSQVRCIQSFIVDKWDVVKPNCEKCGTKNKCLDRIKTYKGLEKTLGEDKKLSGLKLTSEVQIKRSSN